MSKYLVSIFLLALTFGAIESMTAKAGTMNRDETCVCIGPRSNGFNATGTRLNGTCARSQTGPFCFTEGVNGDGIMVVTDSTDYTGFCSSISTNDIDLQINCPEGKILIGGDCESDIPMADTDVGEVNLSGTFTGGSSNLTESFSRIVQLWFCRLDCLAGASDGLTGTLTAVAYCEQP